jgi:primosomal protein N' (replication factor Y) (superfamily II helicase)
MARVRILHTNPALGPLDYRVPHGMAVEPGSIVRVPLGPREMIGAVWEEEALPSEPVGDNRLRNIIEAYDLPPLGAPLRRLIEWTADYYLAPAPAVLRMALASSSALEGGRTVVEYRLTGKTPERMTPQRVQALERIGERQGLVRELATIADVSDGVIRGLIAAGAIEGIAVALDTPYPPPEPDHAPPELNTAQKEAAAQLVDLVKAGEFAPVLLDGVTGSGMAEAGDEAPEERLG